MKRGGERLPPRQRHQAEQALDTDLSDVVVHRNETDLSTPTAWAETRGNEISFAAGQFQPGTLRGDALLAHELAHVAQQRGTPGAAPVARHLAERDADRSVPGMLRSFAGETAVGSARQARRGGLQLSHCDPTESPAAGGQGVHYDEVVSMEGHLSTAELKKRYPELTQFDDGDRADIEAHLTALNAGGVYVFFGHGGQDASGTTVGIMADDGVVRGQAIEDALRADSSPPTLVVLGGCATSDLMNHVRGGGVPIAAGITENVSNVAGAAAVQRFMNELGDGKTLGEAAQAANDLLSRGGILNMSMAQFEVRYADGYSSSMTLQDARDHHRGAP